MDWSILGIEPTTDKKAITKAYRAKLTSTNPEDKPEEFKALRKAYEEALALATKAVTQTDPLDAPTSFVPTNPVEKWAVDLANLYADYQRRLDLNAWRALLSQDVCIALDTHAQTEECLMRFLGKNYFLLQEVWQLFDQRFSFTSRRQELYETYPAAFIDHVVLEGIRSPSVLNYRLFTPGKSGPDCDEYIFAFFDAIHATAEEVDQTCQRLLSLPEQHPYGNAFCLARQVVEGKAEALPQLRQLAAEYPQEVFITQHLADALLASNLAPECEELMKAAVAADETNHHSRFLLASAQAAQGKHKEAIENINELMRTCGGDQRELYSLDDVRREWNESFIANMEQRLAAGKSTNDLLLDLSWAYLQNDLIDKSKETAALMDVEAMDPYDYHNLISQVYLADNDLEKSLEHSYALVDIVKAMKPDGTKKTAKRLARLPHFLTRIGYVLYLQDKPAETIEAYERALAADPQSAETLTDYARTAGALGDFRLALRLSRQLMEAAPSAYHGYLLCAHSLFELGDDREAFNMVNLALEIDPGDLDMYSLKIRILIRNGALNQAQELLTYLQENGAEDETTTIWCEGLLEANTYGPDDESEESIDSKKLALQLFYQVINRIEDGDPFGWPASAYFQAALIEGQIGPRSRKQRRKQLDLLNKGLEIEPRHLDSLDFRGWILRDLGQLEEAVDTYEVLASLPHDGLQVETMLADLYRREVERKAPQALACYQKLLQQQPNNVGFLFYAGMCSLRMKDFDQAEQLFLREQRIEGDCVDSYRMLCLTYMAAGRYPEALAQIDQCIQVGKASNADALQFRMIKARLLRRMGRWDEAVDVYLQSQAEFGNIHAYREAFETLMQAGRYDAAQRHLDLWSSKEDAATRMPPDHSGLVKSRLLLAICTQGTQAARQLAGRATSCLSKDDRIAHGMTAGLLNDDPQACIDIKLAELDRRKKAGEKDLTDVLTCLAFHYWRLGDQEQATSYAQEALAGADAMLARFTACETLYRTKRALALAVLGRTKEAQADLQAAQTLPLCEHCAYAACKDATYYRALVDEICGRFSDALEKARAGMQQWPDETDFWCLEAHLQKALPKADAPGA